MQNRQYLITSLALGVRAGHTLFKLAKAKIHRNRANYRESVLELHQTDAVKETESSPPFSRPGVPSVYGNWQEWPVLVVHTEAYWYSTHLLEAANVLAPQLIQVRGDSVSRIKIIKLIVVKEKRSMSEIKEGVQGCGSSATDKQRLHRHPRQL